MTVGEAVRRYREIMTEDEDDYNSLPMGGVLAGVYPNPLPVGSVITLGVRPAQSCAGCGACDYEAGRCTYCGRNA